MPTAGGRKQDIRYNEAGVHPKIVQERLGHSSIKVKLDTYSQVQAATAQRFDDLLIARGVDNVGKHYQEYPQTVPI